MKKLLMLNAVLMSCVLIALLVLLVRQATTPAAVVSADNGAWVVRGDEISLWIPGDDGKMIRTNAGSLSHPAPGPR